MVILYVFVIIVANVITTMFPPIMFWNLIIPCGSFLVGVTFFLRDFIQLRTGKTKVYQYIMLAALLSGLVSVLFGDTAYVAVASVISFFMSEALDTELFSRLKFSLRKRVIISGTVGGLFDSIVFILIALSPLGSGILGWESVPYAILGQTLVKCCMQFVAIPIVSRLK